MDLSNKLSSNILIPSLSFKFFATLSCRSLMTSGFMLIKQLSYFILIKLRWNLSSALKLRFCVKTHDQQRPQRPLVLNRGVLGSIGFNWQTDALESRSFERDWLNLQCAALESKLYIYHIIYMLYLMIPSAATGTVTSFGAGLCARVILTWLLWHGHLRSGVRGQRRDFFFGARFLLEWKIFF